MTAVVGAAGDAELVELAKAGDRDAFRQLFDRHAHRVAGACRKKTRSNADVDDAVQEAFLRALANLDQLRNPEQFGAWVRSIAVRACLDQHRHAKRVVVIDDERQVEQPDVAPQPDEMAERRERDAALWASMRHLGDRDRTALYLRHVVEAPVAAVAAELGLTEGSTRVMLVRARERLRGVATGLVGLLPLGLRRWFRDHVPAAMPAMEAIAIVVVVGVAAGVIAGPDPVETPGRQHSVVERNQRKATPADRPVATRRSTQALAARPEGTPPARGGAAPAVPDSPSQEPDADRPRPLQRVRDSVQVRRQYPEPEETDELVDVTVFSEDESNDVRLYGNGITDTTQPAAAEVKSALGLGD